jgi:hypothetical protein
MEWSQLCMDHSICLRICRSLFIDWLLISNVLTVKEHTFYKRSTNIPTANRNENKMSEFVSESALSKEIISIWSRRADCQIETICSQQDKFGNDTKMFRFRFKNYIRTFVLSFLTLLLRIMMGWWIAVIECYILCWNCVENTKNVYSRSVSVTWRTSDNFLKKLEEYCHFASWCRMLPRRNNKSLHFTYFSVTY